MLAFGIRYLNGFVAAAEPDSHERPEWPPHPARVFMALAAAHFETGADPSERDALEWLERLDRPPRIHVGEASALALVTHFVPVNDRGIWTKDPSKPKQQPPPPLQSAPGIMRVRNERTFARAWLDDDVAYMSWPEAQPPEATRAALGALCAKVTRIGHSSSLVHMWLASPDEIKEPSWVPNGERAEIFLRRAVPGTLEYLERCFNRNEVEGWGDLMVMASDPADTKAQKTAKKRLKSEHPDGRPMRSRPELRIFEGYARPRPSVETGRAPGTLFSPHFIVRAIERESGPYKELDLLCAPQVIQRWREAILKQSNDLPAAVRRLISGHDAQGAPLEDAHLAFVPLAFVGHRHADGHLLGMGIVLPDGLQPDDRRHALRAIARVDRLLLGRLGAWRTGSVKAAEPPWNLRSDVWTAHPGGATHWSTVTPIAFDRHPKEKDRSSYQREIARMIAEAATRIGLPEPRDVIVTAVSAHLGVPPAHAFPRLHRKDGSQRRHAHAILVFGERVRGPILLGAGRYRGYGVCRPLHDEGASA
jgi:CRISPR-associated protein Csb2